MSPDVHILLSGALSFGVPLALAIRELIVLGRDPGTPGNGGDARERLPVPTPPDHDPALPPLPPSLVRALRADADEARREPRRVRVLERA